MRNAELRKMCEDENSILLCWLRLGCSGFEQTGVTFFFIQLANSSHRKMIVDTIAQRKFKMNIDHSNIASDHV